MIEKDIFFEKNINKKGGVILDFFSIEFKLFIFFKKYYCIIIKQILLTTSVFVFVLKTNIF
jgi:hypothetical protein